MKRALIVTLQGDNIGNRLQNYALQEVVKSFGIEVHTPYYSSIEHESLNGRIKFNIKVLLGKLGIPKYKRDYIKKKRLDKYKLFNAKYIDNLFFIKYSNVIINGLNQFDYAITGSDQVWHSWSSNKDELRYFYLRFIDRKKRISYAPSFGFEVFPESDIDIHSEGILGIKELSCRERKGAKLIRELTGRNAKVVLDPTLLLDRDEWEKLEKKPDWISHDRYLLCYFLGKTDEYREIIRTFANKKGLVIVDAYNADSLESQLTTPDEFLWLVKRAEYICTDSFHATVFSLIFEKKFLSFKRKEIGMDKMFNRIETVQDIFGVHRIYDNNIECIELDYPLNDISSIKEDSIRFLAKALQAKEKFYDRK